jgi:hypothetical protein
MTGRALRVGARGVALFGLAFNDACGDFLEELDEVVALRRVAFRAEQFGEVGFDARGRALRDGHELAAAFGVPDDLRTAVRAPRAN